MNRTELNMALMYSYCIDGNPY